MPDVRRLPAANVKKEVRKPNGRPASRRIISVSRYDPILHTEFEACSERTPEVWPLFTSVVAVSILSDANELMARGALACRDQSAWAAAWRRA